MVANSKIQRIRFRRDLPGIAQLVGEGFQPVLSVEGIDFQEYLELARRFYLPLFMGPLHLLISRFFEVFAWVHENELLGTGTVQRLRFSDKTKWVLANFAVSRKRAINITTVITMRSLMRRAIKHARLNGATEISAHVRENNEAVYALCKGEGFEVVGEDSYYLLSPAQIRSVQQVPRPHSGIAVGKSEPEAVEALVWRVIGWVCGFHRSIYLVQFERNTIAEIQLTSHPSSISSCQVEMRPLVDLSLELACGLIKQGLVLASGNNERRVLIAFPTACLSLKQLMEQHGIPVVFKRKRLSLRTERKN